MIALALTNKIYKTKKLCVYVTHRSSHPSGPMSGRSRPVPQFTCCGACKCASTKPGSKNSRGPKQCSVPAKLAAATKAAQQAAASAAALAASSDSDEGVG